MKNIEIKANGEANSYTITQGGRWIAQVLMNGELTILQQQQILGDMLKTQVISVIQPSNVAVPFGTVKHYSVGDVVVWKGCDAAILRMENEFHVDVEGPMISRCAKINDNYNSCHYSNLRPATLDEIALLGEKDIYKFY